MAGCFTLPDKKEIEKKLAESSQATGLTYTDSRNTYSVTSSLKEAGPIEEDGTVSLTALSDRLITAGGSYVDHFKEGPWIYNSNITSITTVSWSKYEIGQLGIETNLSIKGTTSTIDAHTELYFLPVKEDSILIRFYADTLGARAKRRPYEDILKDEMESKGYRLRDSNNRILEDSNHIISISKLVFTNNKDAQQELHMEVASAQLSTGFLAYATSYHKKNEAAAAIFFDGILTNLFLNKERFYQPFRKTEKATEAKK